MKFTTLTSLREDINNEFLKKNAEAGRVSKLIRSIESDPFVEAAPAKKAAPPKSPPRKPAAKKPAAKKPAAKKAPESGT